jgi:hypothetical protein
MDEELNSLLNHGTWEERMTLPKNARPIGCRWVFDVKEKLHPASKPKDCTWAITTNSDGTFNRFKARLVAQGFTQREGIDYHETYAPVVRAEVLRLGLALSTTSADIVIDQMDVVTAFLNGSVQEDLFMKSPKGYQTRAKFVKLVKSLYGLKQAQNEWFKLLDDFIVHTLNFQRVKSTSCVYVKRTPRSFIIVMVYVDDLAFIGLRELIDETKTALSERFNIKDLGAMRKCIGIEVKRQTDGSIFLSQRQYTLDVLQAYGMADCKPQSIPADPRRKLTKMDSPQDEIEKAAIRQQFPTLDYRACVGHLLFLLNTRLDIAFALGEVAQFVQNPASSHFVAL